MNISKTALGVAILAMVLATPYPWHGVAAAEGTWVTVEASVPMADRSQADSRRMALEKAQRLAIAKAVGADLTFNDLYVHTRLGGSRSHAIPHGEIVQSTVLTERATLMAGNTAAPAAGDYKIKLKAAVKRSTAGNNPAFRIFADLNQNAFVDGDEMQLHIQSTADCYLMAFVLLEDERVLKLLPSALGHDAFLAAGKRLDFPSAEDIKRGVRLQAHLAESDTITHEAVYILALQKPFEGLSHKIKEGIYSLYDGSTGLINELVGQIVTIPPDQRAEALIYYQIRPN